MVVVMVYFAFGTFRGAANPVQSAAVDLQAAAEPLSDGSVGVTLHATRSTRCTLAANGAATFELALEAGVTRTIECMIS